MRIEAAAAEPTSLAELLAHVGITRVAIIDDTYDGPSTAEVPLEVREEFCARVEYDAPSQAQLRGLGLEIRTVADLTDDTLRRLWDMRTSLGALEAPWTMTIGQRLEERRSVLDHLATHLTELRLSVQTLGRDGPVEPPVQIAFLDYYLGPAEQDASVRHAAARARQIHDDAGAGKHKPILVLMSWAPAVQEGAVLFRRESGFVGGMFHCILKDTLGDLTALDLHLHAIARALPTAHRIQAFVDAVDAKLETAVREFRQDIRELTLADYAYLQRLSLEADGHPLGDYILWLFSTYFGHLLFATGLRDEQAALDALVFESGLPSPAMPSSRLASLYARALFDHAGPVERHPHAGAPGESAPALYLGDVFFRDRAALMILNAQCDLDFAPRGKRRIPADRSVMLLPGDLLPVTTPLRDEDMVLPRTELFQQDADLYRIVWRPKNLCTVPFGNIQSWLQDARYERRARLRLPYALEMQRVFTADLSRVGVPAMPPLYQPVTVELLHSQNDDPLSLFRALPDGSAFLTLRKADPDHPFSALDLVLTVELVTVLKRELETRRDALQAQLATDDRSAPDWQKQRAILGTRLARLREATENHVAWTKLLDEPLALPKPSKARQLEPLPIHLGHEIAIGRARPDKVMELLINVRTASGPKPTNDSDRLTEVRREILAALATRTGSR